MPKDSKGSNPVQDLPYSHRHPRSRIRQQHDPTSYHNWVVEKAERDPLFPAGAEPIEQEELLRQNKGALWVMGIQLQSHQEGVDESRLPLWRGRPHGIDPFGRLFVYMIVTNRYAKPGRQNRGGIRPMFSVLIRVPEGEVWTLSPNAFAMMMTNRSTIGGAFYSTRRHSFQRRNPKDRRDIYQRQN